MSYGPAWLEPLLQGNRHEQPKSPAKVILPTPMPLFKNGEPPPPSLWDAELKEALG